MNSEKKLKLFFCSILLIFLIDFANGGIPTFRNQLGEVLEFEGWGEPGVDFVEQQFIANFKTDYLVLPYGKTEAELNDCTVDPELLEILQNHNIYYVEQVFKGLDSGDTTMTVEQKVIRIPDLSQIYVLHQDGGVVVDAINELYDFEGTVYAEPSYFAYADAPDDLNWGDQWNLFMPDEVHDEYGIGAERAWESTTGGGVIRIGFIDTGMDYTLNDLGGCPGPPWDCDKVIGGRDYFSFPIPDPDPMDGRGHGTSCAHIAAAYTNNIWDIAGIAGGWGDWSTREDVGALLIALKIASDDPGGGWCFASQRAQAIYEAGHPDHFNCNIMSCSWGYEASSMPTTERAAILIGYLAGASFVASAGNESTNLPHFPSSFDETWVTSVGSYGPTGCRCDNDIDCN
jgi:subtilisin family serine protease